MHILIVNQGIIPAIKYGGTERVIWCLGRELVGRGHVVTYLVNGPSYCPFASVIIIDPSKGISEQIPAHVDIVHFNFPPTQPVAKPHLITIHGNCNDQRLFNVNTVFVSRNHALRYGSACYVYNGLNWNDYTKPDFSRTRSYFHFLGRAAWRLKNVKGAINIIRAAKNEQLKVLGGTRLNINMGFRLTLSPQVRFYGMVDGAKKDRLLNASRGFIFPVRWHEPFGVAIIESLYFGCPVFGTPYGSLPELVPAEMGFLSANLQDHVTAIKDAGRYSATACSAYAAECFNVHTMAVAYEKKYHQVLNGEQLNPTPPQLKEVQTEKFLPWNE
jgi:glycosyltransferase involved in cell wall biosynthesis